MSQEQGIVENLVTQFSSALDCLRELVQNSIDAGSPQVDIWMEFERGESEVGTIALHVDDFGEGMDEHIIDNQLTTLFASAKENDLTKIGKFGIGFVSVFALKPRGILLHTGRAGEFWEVFFHEDRSFSKTKLDFPVEGTQITLFLEGDYRRYRELSRDVRDTLKHWCRHSETEISYEDRSPPPGVFSELEAINEPFEIEGDCAVRVEHQGTEMVIAFQARPSYGFYNRGLALAYSEHAEDVLFERARRYAQIGFKLKSRYLEHTLSRETIMRDANYEKAMQLLDHAVASELTGALGGELVELAALTRWSYQEAQRYMHLLELLHGEPLSSLAALATRPILRALHGPPLSLERAFEIWERDGRLLASEQPTPLSEHLHHVGVPVIYGRALSLAGERRAAAPCNLFSRYATAQVEPRLSHRVSSWVNQNIYKVFGSALESLSSSLCPPEQAFLPVRLEPSPGAEAKALLEGVTRLFRDIDAGYGSFSFCEPTNHSERGPLFVIAPKLSSFMAHPPALSKRPKEMHVALNVHHPYLLQLIPLFNERPAVATYMLAKSLLLEEDRLLERDVELMRAALGA